MKAFAKFCKEEPVRAMAILNALIVAAVAFGAKLSTEQIAAIVGLGSVILGVGSQIVRAQVKPLATMTEVAAISTMRQEKAEEAKK